MNDKRDIKFCEQILYNLNHAKAIEHAKSYLRWNNLNKAISTIYEIINRLKEIFMFKNVFIEMCCRLLFSECDHFIIYKTRKQRT